MKSLGLTLCCLLLVLTRLQSEKTDPASDMRAVATFGGGCFWCLQPVFHGIDGVLATSVGFMGGHTDQPTYEQVATGTTGHAEVIHIVYNPHLISYRTLLILYWKNVDYTPSNGAVDGRNSQYRSVIFAHSAEQTAAAERSKAGLAAQRPNGSVVTTIEPASAFTPAAEKHQHY
jgi:peptide-methionine (S)-S-oxide reductase